MALTCRPLLPTRGRPALSQGGEPEMAALSVLVLLGLGGANGQPLAAGSVGTRVRRAALPSAMVWASHPSTPFAPQC